MKSIPRVLAAITITLLASACAGGGARNSALESSNSQRTDAERPASRGKTPRTDQLSIDDGSGNKILIETVEFQAGVSSITVERLAKKYGCEGGAGAGRIAGKGPLEMYRMSCDNGRAFLAKCELRQCQPLR